MGALALGARIEGARFQPELPGVWAVWSQAGEIPGGYFLTPGDDAAYATRIKYVVIRAKQTHTEAKPELELIRTDPPRPDITDQKTRTYGKKIR